MYVLQNAHWFVLLIGALVFFHELGHFVVAKLCDVQVTRFSLGFGPRLIGFVRGETEYTVSLLPLGGYVKMAGEEPGEQGVLGGRGLAQKPLWQRALIVIAGPLSNLLLAFAVYLTMFTGAHTFGDTKLGVVTENDPAWAGGLRAGDRIATIDGQAVADWDELQAYIGERPGQQLHIGYERGDQLLVAAVQSGTRQEADAFGQLSTRGKIGVSLQYVLPVIAVLDATSPAARAGLQTGDRITAIDNRPLVAWHEVAQAVAALPPGATFSVAFQRGDGEAKTVSLTGAAFPPALAALHRLSAADGPSERGYTGLVAKEAVVDVVRPDSPAAAAGVLPGDRLLTAVVTRTAASSAVRRPVSVWSVDLPAMALSAGDAVSLELQRGLEVLTVSLQVAQHDEVDDYHQAHSAIDVGLSNAPGLLAGYTREAPVGFGRGSIEAGRQVWADMSLIGRGIAKMASGKVPLASMGGPIMLFVIAEKSAKRGWEAFGRALAMTSVNLGLLNVLPIPVLDGGHLLFYGIEAITRRPPSLRVREVANMVGMGLLLLLMAVVFRNDIGRFLLG